MASISGLSFMNMYEQKGVGSNGINFGSGHKQSGSVGGENQEKTSIWNFGKTKAPNVDSARVAGEGVSSVGKNNPFQPSDGGLVARISAINGELTPVCDNEHQWMA